MAKKGHVICAVCFFELSCKYPNTQGAFQQLLGCVLQSTRPWYKQCSSVKKQWPNCDCCSVMLCCARQGLGSTVSSVGVNRTWCCVIVSA